MRGTWSSPSRKVRAFCAGRNLDGLGSPFLQETWRFIGAGAPAGGDGNIQDTKVDAELAAVLIPVAEHDIAKKEPARLSQNFFAADTEAPDLVHVRVGHI